VGDDEVGDRVVRLLLQEGDGLLSQLRGELGIEGDHFRPGVVEEGLGEEAGLPTVEGVQRAARAPGDRARVVDGERPLEGEGGERAHEHQGDRGDAAPAVAHDRPDGDVNRGQSGQQRRHG
jgi:hypothetical protein